jgi:RNA polymerase sigma-70 factor, ECF subfamily
MDHASEIVRRHGPMVWRTVCRLAGGLGREADAADCFQEVFVAALEAARRGRERGEVRNWEAMLRRIATVKALDMLRRRIGERGRFAGDAAVEDIHAKAALPNEALERAELAGELRAALTRLPAEQAEAFCLRHVEGMSYEEIGAQTGMTPNAAGVLIHRAKERLRELLNVCETRRGDI